MTPIGKKKFGAVNELISCLLHAYFFMRRGLTLGVRAIVRSNSGEFLLVRHTYTPGWHFPGGGVEKGQTAEQALRNELKEETNLKLVGKPVLHGVFHNSGVSKRDHILAYICKVEGRIEIKSSRMEICEIGYFSFEDLPSDTDPGTARCIHEIICCAAKREVW